MDTIYTFTVIAAYFVCHVTGQGLGEFSFEPSVSAKQLVDPTKGPVATPTSDTQNVGQIDLSLPMSSHNLPSDQMGSTADIADVFGINLDMFGNRPSQKSSSPDNVVPLDILDRLLDQVANETNQTSNAFLRENNNKMTDFMAFLSADTTPGEPTAQGTEVQTTSGAPTTAATIGSIDIKTGSDAKGVPFKTVDQFSVFEQSTPSPSPSADPFGFSDPFAGMFDAPYDTSTTNEPSTTPDTLGFAVTTPLPSSDPFADMFGPTDSDPFGFQDNKNSKASAMETTTASSVTSDPADIFGPTTESDPFASAKDTTMTSTPTPEVGTSSFVTSDPFADMFGPPSDSDPFAASSAPSESLVPKDPFANLFGPASGGDPFAPKDTTNANTPNTDNQANPVILPNTNPFTSGGVNEVFGAAGNTPGSTLPSGGNDVFNNPFSSNSANNPFAEQGNTNANENTLPVDSSTSVDIASNALPRGPSQQGNSIFNTGSGQQRRAPFSMGNGPALPFPRVPGNNNIPPMQIPNNLPQRAPPQFEQMPSSNQLQRFPQIPQRGQQQDFGMPQFNRLGRRLPGQTRGLPAELGPQAFRQQRPQGVQSGARNQQSMNRQNLLPFAENVLQQVQTLVDNLREIPGGRSLPPRQGQGQGDPGCRERCGRDLCLTTRCINIESACVANCSDCRAHFYAGGADVTHLCQIREVGLQTRRGPSLGRMAPVNSRFVPGPNGQPVLVPVIGPEIDPRIPPQNAFRRTPNDVRNAILAAAGRGQPEIPVPFPRGIGRVQGSLERQGGRIDPRDPRLQFLPPQLMAGEPMPEAILRRGGNTARRPSPEAIGQPLPPNVAPRFPQQMNGLPLTLVTGSETIIDNRDPQQIMPTDQAPGRPRSLMPFQTNQTPNLSERRRIIESFERARAAARQIGLSQQAGGPQISSDNPTNILLRNLRRENSASNVARQTTNNVGPTGATNLSNQQRGGGFPGAFIPVNAFARPRGTQRSTQRSARRNAGFTF